MGKLETFKKLWAQDKHQVLVAFYNNIVHTGITNLLPDKAYLKLTYRIRFGEKLDFNNPVTFNQKIQWLKIYDRQERYIDLVDKVKVKEYVKNAIGSEYIIPTLGVWDSFDEIDFHSLPNKFVLKCNHDSGSIVVCDGKENFDTNSARKKIMQRLKADAYYWGREWPYKHIQRKILAEPYLKEQQISFVDKEKATFTGCTTMNNDREIKITTYTTSERVSSIEGFVFTNDNYKKRINIDDITCSIKTIDSFVPLDKVDLYKINDDTLLVELFPIGKTYFETIPSDLYKVLDGNWIRLHDTSLVLVEDNIVFHLNTEVSRDLTDYKLFCFDGQPKFCQIITGRSNNESIDFYDLKWNHQPFVGLTSLVENSGVEFLKPLNYDKMIHFSQILSSGTKFARVDFYEINGKLYFGEITLYPASGFGYFTPKEWNTIMGSFITLKSEKEKL